MTVLVPEYGRWPTEVALERRDPELVALADATVFFSPDHTTERLVKLANAKGVPTHVHGAGVKAKVKAAREEVEPGRRGLPD